MGNEIGCKGWDAALTPPLILGGYVYVASGQFIYKMDKNTGDIVQTSERMSGNMQYAMIPLAYAEGMLLHRSVVVRYRHSVLRH